jgi:hypothetical protein
MEYDFSTLPIELKLGISHTNLTGNIIARADLISRIPNHLFQYNIAKVLSSDIDQANPVMVMQEALTLIPTLCEKFLKHFSELESCDEPLAKIMLKGDK